MKAYLERFFLGFAALAMVLAGVLGYVVSQEFPQVLAVSNNNNGNNGNGGENGQETCPNGGDWVKIDGLSGLTYTFTSIPSGYSVTDNCMKVGDFAPLYGTGATVTNTTLFNSPGGTVCTAPGVPHNGCALQSISHASFKLQQVVTPTSHLECEAYACVEVDGAGEDECDTIQENSTECGYEEQGSETHLACVDNACQEVAGEGVNTCDEDADCVVVTPPTPTPTTNLSSNLSHNGPTCTNNSFEVIFELKENDAPAPGRAVTITYNGVQRTGTTNNDGKFVASFTYTGPGDVVAEAAGFDTVRTFISDPCTNVVIDPNQGQVLGASTENTSTIRGKVLGASTMAGTGVATDILMDIMGGSGALLTLAGSVLRNRKRA